MGTKGKAQAPAGRTPLRSAVAALLRSWFGLTPDEQKAILLLLGLFLLGLTVRWWHLHAA
jgi:type II secretory pathway component PulM